MIWRKESCWLIGWHETSEADLLKNLTGKNSSFVHHPPPHEILIKFQGFFALEVYIHW